MDGKIYCKPHFTQFFKSRMGTFINTVYVELSVVFTGRGSFSSTAPPPEFANVNSEQYNSTVTGDSRNSSPKKPLPDINSHRRSADEDTRKVVPKVLKDNKKLRRLERQRERDARRQLMKKEKELLRSKMDVSEWMVSLIMQCSLNCISFEEWKRCIMFSVTKRGNEHPDSAFILHGSGTKGVYFSCYEQRDESVIGSLLCQLDSVTLNNTITVSGPSKQMQEFCNVWKKWSPNRNSFELIQSQVCLTCVKFFLLNSSSKCTCSLIRRN